MSEVNKRLKKKNYNKFIFQNLKIFNFSLFEKKKKSNYIIKNDFKKIQLANS